MHSGQKTLECDVCKKRFSQSTDQAKLKITVHQKKATFKCHVCSETFSNKQTFKRHTKKSHLVESSIQCNICDREIFQSLRRSRKNEGSSENHYSCDVCQELDSSTATGIGYICFICDVVFETANELENHMSVHDNVLKH